MLADIFWNVATSSLVLSALGAIFVAAFLLSHTPTIVEKVWPQAYLYIKAAGLVEVVAAAALCFLVGFRLADERGLTRQLKNDLAFKQLQIETAEGTAQEAERLKAEAEAKAALAKGALDDFRKTFADKPMEASCAFTADDLERLRQLRQPKRR